MTLAGLSSVIPGIRGMPLKGMRMAAKMPAVSTVSTTMVE